MSWIRWGLRVGALQVNEVERGDVLFGQERRKMEGGGQDSTYVGRSRRDAHRRRIIAGALLHRLGVARWRWGHLRRQTSGLTERRFVPRMIVGIDDDR